MNYFSEDTAADDFAFIQGNKANLGDPWLDDSGNPSRSRLSYLPPAILRDNIPGFNSLIIFSSVFVAVTDTYPYSYVVVVCEI